MDLVGEFLKLVKVEGTATVRHAGDPRRLDRWPLLVGLAGGTVCTEDRQVPVFTVRVAFLGTPDVEAVAVRLGTTEAHVRQALEYARVMRETL